MYTLLPLQCCQYKAVQQTPSHVCPVNATVSCSFTSSCMPLLRLHREDTKVAAKPDADAAWRERVLSHSAASTSTSPQPASNGHGSGGGAAAGSGSDNKSLPEFHFICECFFMTLKGLHLGLVKMTDDLTGLQRVGLYLGISGSWVSVCLRKWRW
jgi:hypothetical protein